MPINQEDKVKSRGKEEMFESTSVLERPSLEPDKTAVVIVDMANNRCVRGIGSARRVEESGISVDYYFERLKTMIPNLQRLLSVCRKQGVRVAWVMGGCYTPDFSDCIPQFRKNYKFMNARVGAWEMQPVDPLKVEEGDLYLVKAGSGCFTSNLDVRLRDMGIKQVIYTGMATNGCVLMSVTGGFDLGYYGWLVSDATATYWDRLQTITEELVSGYMARVVTTDEMIRAIEAGVPVTAQAAGSR